MYSAKDLERQDDLQAIFNPIVESTEKSTEAITKELVRGEIKTLNDRLAPSTKVRKEVMHHHLDTIDKSKLDKYFGIQQTD